MTRWLQIDDASMIGEARRITRVAAAEAGLAADAVERAVVVASEAATNLHRHAQAGVFACTRALTGELVLLATDDGPGMENPERMLQDGVSTGTSLGVGLGAMKRMSDTFEIWSRPGDGTVTLSTFGRAQRPSGPFDIAGLRLSAPGETACGDTFGWRARGGRVQILVCDGFGHGPAAARDANAVLDFFESAEPADAGGLMEAICLEPVVERGAVAMLVELDPGSEALSAVGVGNISGAIVTRAESRRVISREGSIGRRCVSRPEPYPFEPGAALILHSDGLKTFRMDDSRKELLHRSPLMIAALVLRDGLRGHDDASIVVVRRKEGPDE